MRFSVSSVLVLSLISTSVNAFVVRDAPVQTTAVRHGHTIDQIPEPTAGPGEQELRRRQAATQRTLLGAPDNTCGYFSGSQPWGCSAGSDCFFATPTPLPANSTQTQTAGSVLCCDPKTGCPAAPAPTACVDRGRNDYNKTCTGSCPTDSMTLKCTSGIYLYCNTLTFAAPSVSALFCNYLSTYDILSATAAQTLTPTVVKFAVVPTTSTKVLSKTSSTTSYSPTATDNSVPTSGGKSTSRKDKIIGGVLGGLAALALIAFLVILFLRWRYAEEEVEPAKK
ncbi:uncharacterized protein LY89DRAFT_788879 [Mollisia scopiformis]|uniref:Uncharacterized protein n=1 Tax=Mollisia scopiformis TaxID=149040 RepID=A0A132B7X2_MOLSC|nr:uncharacterized protein LY89DRAFT_788879 [Mollisia scopiformis]KUJ08506.1 hypothetical protein LY89DRAFT_788879 [Mollisia scopiformis]